MDYLHNLLSPHDAVTLLKILKNPQDNPGIYLWHGTGSNGKSTLRKVIQKSLSHTLCYFSVNDDTIDLSNDIFICEDPNFDQLSPLLKSLFESNKVVICISNQDLTQVRDLGLSRRITPIAFNHRFNDPLMDSKVEHLSRELSSLIQC